MTNPASSLQYLGNYRVISTLGQGGMGRVHLVQDPSGQYYAAKELLFSPEGWAPEKLKRFELECSLLARLNSPHIVKPFGSIQQDKQVYFYLMEYVPGKNLQQLLKTYGRFAPETATHYMLQLLNALETAHQAQIIHRDIKPSNLIIDPQGILKVTDFGIAFDLTATHFTQTGCFLGTPYSISPEQARGEESVPASDLYSLGIVFYELLVGEPPFKANNALALLYQHQEKTPPRLKAVLPEAPQALEDFLERCLKKLPQERFESATLAKKSLESIFCEFSVAPETLLQTTQSIGKEASLPLPSLSVMTSRKETRTLQKAFWFLAIILAMFLALLWVLNIANPFKKTTELKTPVSIRLNDQSVIEGNWLGIKDHEILYQKDFQIFAVPTEQILEILEKDPFFPPIEVYFRSFDRPEEEKRLVRFLGVASGYLYGLDGQNRFQIFKLPQIREYRYLPMKY